MLGAGADDLILLCARAFAGPGDTVAIPDAPTYPVYKIAAQLARAGVGDDDPVLTFACRPGSVAARQVYLAQLLAPAMHAAWVRTQVTRTPGAADKAHNPSVLTARELDILKWIYLGKSNFEIGAILKISPLTVKNHVQKILRKLNVVNRTQAIGKALELRIFNP